MSDVQKFEAKTWADAEVQIGPGNPAHPDHAAWLAEQDNNETEQAEQPADEQEEASN
jgi:hypothetical protein